MGKKLNSEGYEMNRMDDVIERDVADLRAMLSEIPEPSEPHPAYWNNFLLRVHERIDEKQAPKRKAWWSPALIWGSLSGVAGLLLIAFMTGVFPFGSDGVVSGEEFAHLSSPGDLELTPRPLDMDTELYVPGIDEEIDGSYSIVLTESELNMINAISDGDDEAILQAMIDDVDFEI
ncbi:MAG: hypothetical protein KDD67_00800 [Ignavibacteriae bacterium]|nr:hypothetical protein [Ignavibacteriota bacterium]MCB9216032.1 hypothetical protein [Ignavibacteria bacterium]